MFNFKSKAENLEDKGTRLAQKGRHREAITYLQQATDLEPENGIFRYNLGLAYVNSNDIRQALEEFKLSIRFSPNYADSYFAIATGIFPQDPDWKAAIYYLAYLDFSKHGEMARTSERRLGELGRQALTFDTKQWLELAEVNYSEFVKNMGNMGSRLGHTISQQKPEEDVIVNGLQSWLSDIAPQKAMQWAGPHFENGVNLAEKGKYRAAIAQFVTGLDILPHDQPALCLLASTYAFSGDFQQASDILNLVNVEKVNPDSKQFLANQIAELKNYILSHRNDAR